MKKFLPGFLIMLVSLLIFLSPWRSPYEWGAYPENLYTSDGQWKKQADPALFFYCVRTEYGLGLSWLVYDCGKNQDAWYAKLRSGVLFLHVLAAITAGVCGTCLLRRGKMPKNFQR